MHAAALPQPSGGNKCETEMTPINQTSDAPAHAPDVRTPALFQMFFRQSKRSGARRVWQFASQMAAADAGTGV
jgi:hypothetical protein